MNKTTGYKCWKTGQNYHKEKHFMYFMISILKLVNRCIIKMIWLSFKKIYPELLAQTVYNVSEWLYNLFMRIHVGPWRGNKKLVNTHSEPGADTWSQEGK